MSRVALRSGQRWAFTCRDGEVREYELEGNEGSTTSRLKPGQRYLALIRLRRVDVDNGKYAKVYEDTLNKSDRWTLVSEPTRAVA